jgi:hypothetical protein
MHGGLEAEDDLAQQLSEGGEEQLVRVLPLGGAFEEGIQAGGVQEALQDGAGQDTDGPLLDEGLKDGLEEHSEPF